MQLNVILLIFCWNSDVQLNVILLIFCWNSDVQLNVILLIFCCFKVDGSKKLKCTLCSTEFLYKSSLDEHMNIIHKGSRYMCDVCGEVVIEAKTMTEHRRNEHPAFPYVDPGKLLNIKSLKQPCVEKGVDCEVGTGGMCGMYPAFL